MYGTSTYRDAPAINTAMGRVYFYMMTAVLNSMLVSYVIGHSPEAMQFLFTGVMKYVVIFAPLVAVFLIVPVIAANPPTPVAIGMLHLFAGLMGMSFATIFVVYSMGSIFTAFMGAAVLFGVMSVYGYFTRTDLSHVGQMATVALIAIIIASLINLFIGSTLFQMIISAIAIVVFLGFTAYDTQTIRESVSIESDDSVSIEVLGALTLYLDFINLFINLLQIIGVTTGSDD